MRQRRVILLALVVLLLDATWTRFAADPPPPVNMSVVGWIIPISGENTNCPVATHDLRECPSIPPNAYYGYYLEIDESIVNGWRKDNMWGKVLGDLDLNTCAPYRLIHVRRLAKTELFPLPCD